jgi:hypothetical protein
MKLAVRSDWSAGYGESSRLQFLLYVRDAAALTPHGGLQLPALQPAVAADLPQSLSASRRQLLSKQWQSWWTDMFGTVEVVERRKLPEPRRDLPELTDRPELQQVARDLFHQAQVWLDLRATECAELIAHGGTQDRLPVEYRIVEEAVAARRGLERLARVGPFRLSVSGLPLAGMHGWHISAGHALVTRSLRQDPEAYRRWLLPLAQELVRSPTTHDRTGTAPRC